MQAFDYDEVLDMILAKDGRYHRDAYYFVREGLDFTQQKLTKAAGAKEPRHVSGRELMDGMRFMRKKITGRWPRRCSMSGA